VAVGDPEAESRREEIAGTGQVDDLPDRVGGHLDGAVGQPERHALLAEGHRHGEPRTGGRLERAGNGPLAAESEELGFVGEHDVDGSRDEPLEDGAVPLDEEGVRQPEGDRGTPAPGCGHEPLDDRRRVGEVEKVALDVDELGVPHDLGVDPGRVEPAAGTEEGRHRPLGVRRDDRGAPPRRHPRT
jgi:hypothetical protein